MSRPPGWRGSAAQNYTLLLPTLSPKAGERMGACGGITTTKTAPVTLSERPFLPRVEGPLLDPYLGGGIRTPATGCPVLAWFWLGRDHAHLRREVGRDVQHQLRQVRGKGVDLAVRGRHNRHVRRNRSINRVQ